MKDESITNQAGSGAVNMNIDCNDIAAMLSGLVDDVFSSADRHAAERHLTQCEACTALLEEAEAIDDMVERSVDTLDSLPKGFETAVLMQTTRKTLPRQRSNWWMASGWLAAAASITVAAFVVTSNSNQIQQDNSNIVATTDLNTITSNPGLDQSNPAVDDVRKKNRSTNIILLDNGKADIIATASWTYRPGPEAVSAVSDGYLPTVRSTVMTVANSIEEPETQTIEVQPKVVNAAPAESSELHAANTTPQLDEVSANSKQISVSNEVQLSRDDEDVLFAVANLLELLIYEADDTSMRTAEELRERIEYDQILERLSKTREHTPANEKSMILVSEGLLIRLVHGPVNLADLRDMREIIRTLNLIGELDRMTGRINPDRAM